MKTFRKVCIALAVLSMLAGCAGEKESTDTAETTTETESVEAEVTGSWTLNSDVRAAVIDADILEIFDKTKQAYGEDDLQALAVLGTQVVSGTNYAILAKRESGQYVIVILYVDLGGSGEISKVTLFDISKKSYGELEDGELTGGWTSSTLESSDPEDKYVKILEKAQEGFVGSSLKYIMCLGTQLVSGTNYCFLCESTLVTAEPVTAPKLVYVYEDLEGNCSITDIADISLAYFNE